MTSWTARRVTTAGLGAREGGSARPPNALSTVAAMASKAVTSSTDRVAERRRAVALARHFRDAEGLSIVHIAERLGRSPTAVKAYSYDPS